MSYRIDSPGPPRLLAGVVRGTTSYLSVGVPDHGLPEAMGYSEDEIEVEVLVQAAWVLQRDVGPIIVSPAFCDMLRNHMAEVNSPKQLLQEGRIPRYCRVGDKTVAIPTSIPLMRLCLSVLGAPSAILCAGLAIDTVRLALVEDGLAIRGKVTNHELQAIADRTYLQLDTSDRRVTHNNWVVEHLDQRISRIAPYLAAL